MAVSVSVCVSVSVSVAGSGGVSVSVLVPGGGCVFVNQSVWLYPGVTGETTMCENGKGRGNRRRRTEIHRDRKERQGRKQSAWPTIAHTTTNQATTTN